MTKWLLTVAAGTLAAAAVAQTPYGYPNPYAGGQALPGTGYPGGGYGYQGGGYGGGYGGGAGGAFLPNYYNRATQPLSPYLNLARGGNPAVNYFFGVRPGLAAAGPGFAGPGFTVGANSQLRTGFLPAAGQPTPDPVPLPAAGVELPGNSFPSAAHPVTFGTGGGFGGGANRGGFAGGTAPPAAPQRR